MLVRITMNNKNNFLQKNVLLPRDLHGDLNQLMMARSDSTVQIPWLFLDCLSPSALMSNEDTEPILQELAISAQGKKEREARLNPQLSNLLRNYAHYRNQQETVPISAAQSEITDKIVNDLSTTLKTILCL